MGRNEIIVPNSFAIQLISLGTSFTLPSNFCRVVRVSHFHVTLSAVIYEEMKDSDTNFYTAKKRKRKINHISNLLDEKFICNADFLFFLQRSKF